MTIQKYEDWMRPQVVQLFNLEYGTPVDEFNKLFGDFYEHDFQRHQCIRIVAVDGEKVAGFQSFFYWPVVSNGKTLRAYQSGNSLVHPDYRGQRLFAKMLNFIHEPDSGFDCELLIGFPVEASYNSFIRNNWYNPFNLQWYVKTLNPLLALISNPVNAMKKKWPHRNEMNFSFDNHITAVEQSKGFDNYRFNYENGDFFRFEYESSGKKAFFEMKAQRRKRILHELIIGKFLTTHHDTPFIEEAFAALVKEVKKAASFSFLSFACNPLDISLNDSILKLGFKPIENKIYFIAKGPAADEVKDWSNWLISRSDIDTW